MHDDTIIDVDYEVIDVKAAPPGARSANNNIADKQKQPVTRRRARIGSAVLWVALALLYMISPDMFPGPIDDVAVNLLALWNLARQINNYTLR